MRKLFSFAARTALAAATATVLNTAVSAHSLVATYVPWGVDEYELFGLTEKELVNKYKGVLGFDPKFTKVVFIGYTQPGFGQPQFEIRMLNGKVVSVKRVFIDGAGCRILGPLFTSKKEALVFSIDGLSKLEPRSPEYDLKLKTAKRMLVELDKSVAGKTISK